MDEFGIPADGWPVAPIGDEIAGCALACAGRPHAIALGALASGVCAFDRTGCTDE